MPAGDGTGPMGAGPMTGRAAGYCAGFPYPGYANPMPGRGGGWGRGMGRGMGRGFGRGWGRGYGMGGFPQWSVAPMVPPVYAAPPSAEQETEALKAQAQHLERSLADIRARLATLESAKEGT